MFLRNYDNFMLALHLFSPVSTYPGVANSSISSNSSSDFGDGYYNIRGTNGSNQSIFVVNAQSGTGYLIPPLMLEPSSICLGDGTTEVTYDDYKLSGNVVDNKLVRISREVAYDTETGKWKVTLVATYNNSGDTDITISEWGLWRKNVNTMGSYNTFNNSEQYCALVFREVLDEPIVIEAGTTATLTFSIDIPMPNHP